MLIVAIETLLLEQMYPKQIYPKLGRS